MSLLVISDTHLHSPVSQKKFRFLKDLINDPEYTSVIINGDFWEGYGIKFDHFMRSQWRELFPLLKQKHAVYIYGNHDKRSFSDDRIYEFCDVATERYEIDIGPSHFIFEHGHRIAWKIDAQLHIVRPNTWSFWFFELLQTIYIYIVGAKGFWILFGKFNNQIKRHLRSELLDEPNHVFVCGHTHCAEIDLPAKFVNGGIFKYGYAQYLTISDTGEVKLHDRRYDRDTSAKDYLRVML